MVCVCVLIFALLLLHNCIGGTFFLSIALFFFFVFCVLYYTLEHA